MITLPVANRIKSPLEFPDRPNDYDLKVMAIAKEAHRLRQSRGFAVAKAFRLQTELEQELKLDEIGNPKQVAITIKAGTKGFVSAGGWGAGSVILPDHVEGFVDHIFLGNTGPTLAVNAPVMDCSSREIIPGNFSYILPMIGQAEEPVLSYVPLTY